MKPNFYNVILFFALILFSFSCKTASKLYEKGNYNEAVEVAAKKLQKDPGDVKLIALIQNAYQYAVKDHENQVRLYAAGNNELKWEHVYNEYASLQNLFETINKVPSITSIVKPIDYNSYIQTYAEKASEVRMNRGLAFMNKFDKRSYQQAYREFQAALRFTPGQRDIIQKKEEAYDYAVTNVIILPIQQQNNFRQSNYSPGSSNIEDKIIRSLQFGAGNEFVKFYSTWDARSRQIRIDQEVDMHIARFNIGRYFDNRSTRTVSKDVLVKETVYRPDSVVKEYAKVFATITTTNRTMRSNALLDIIVRDYNGRWLWNDNINSDHSWNTSFATYTGDARALSEADKQIINRRQDFSPSEHDITRHLFDELSQNALYRIKNYFNRY